MTMDGTETHLSTPGSTLIQRGTLHAWENRGTEWVRWISVLIDAEPVVLGDGHTVPEEAWDEEWESPFQRAKREKEVA